MSFTAGDLVASIRVDGMQQFERDIDRGGQMWSRLGSVASGATRTIAAGTTTAGAVMAGLVASLFKGGVGYNQLQQTSRAALRTMLGGAEAANAQMDKLDAFARTSPFAKQVFIQAQQQMLGFGIEAKKVIPYLDAIQNGVAAMGGSNADLAGVVEIFAKIKSSAKITGEDLMQFGNRGIDAATLIGSQFGKTGAEIRAAITEGTLDAQDALDALAAGMQERFGGASAGIKTTLAGAIDRIKAAQREIGAALAEPFVSQQGGGLFVTWGNQVADVMQAVRGHTKPVVDLLSERAAPAFASITESLDKARVAVKSWNPESLKDGLATMERYGPALAAATAGWVAYGAGSIPVIGRFLGVIGPLPAFLATLVAVSPELRAAGGSILQAFEPLIPVSVRLADVLAGALNRAIPIVADGLQLVADVAEPVVDILASIPAPVLLAVGAFIAMRRAGAGAAPVLEGIAGGLQAIRERIAVQAQLGAMAGNTSRLAGAAGVAGYAVQGLGNSLKAAFLTNPVGLAIMAVATAAGLLTIAFADSAQETAEQEQRAAALRDTLNETTAAVTAATEAQVRKNLEDEKAEELAKKIGVSFTDVVQAALGNAEAVERVNKAMTDYNEKHGGFVTGTSGQTSNMTREVQDLQAAIESERSALEAAQDAQRRYRDELRLANAALSDAERSNQRFNDALAIARDVTRDATERLNALKQAIDELRGGTLSAVEAEAKLNETNLNLSEAFAAADENGKLLWQTVLDGSGKLDTTSRAGLNLHEQMSRASDAFLQASQSAYDLSIQAGDSLPAAQEKARAAGQKYIDSLRVTLEEAGLTKEQIDGLIASYFATPETVSTLVTDEGSIGTVDQQLLALAERIRATPDKEVTVTEPLSPAIMRRLKDLGFTVTTLPNGNVKVTSSGIPDVERALNDLARPRTVRIVPQFENGARSTTGGQVVGSHDGNLFAGGRVQAFANGGFPSGVYAGVWGGIHKFAEREAGVPWELYLSGRPSAKERNQRLMQAVAPMLGMQAVPVGPRRPTAAPVTAYPGVGAPQAAPAAQTATAAPTAPTNVWHITTPPNEDPVHIARGLFRVYADEVAGGQQ